jgi:hypothetical protein
VNFSELRLQIGQMNLRLPGADAEAGRRIAQQTGEMLAANSANLPGGQIGALRLRIHAAANASESDLARAVSAAILEHLSRPRHA